MTTIAFDGKQLAVDSQTSCGNLAMSRTERKLWTSVGKYRAVACAGDSAAWPPVIEWIREGCEPTKWADWNVSAWCVRQDGKIDRYVSGHPCQCNERDADGTGAELALGAMAAGATAVEAVEIASRYDVYTGGKVRVFTL